MVTLKINSRAKAMATTMIPQKASINEGLKSLLDVIKVASEIQAKDLSSHLNGRPIKTIERQIKTLIEKNLIERRGIRKTGKYYLY